MKSQHLLIFSALLLTACAGSPFKTEGIDRTLTPSTALNSSHIGKTALWGGMIIQTSNRENVSTVEVLAYPLDGDGEPVRSASAQGRFLIRHDGYLESATYTAGKWLSVLGTVEASKTGQVGEAKYTYPVIHARQLHLWPIESGRSDTRFRFGVGIGIHL